MKKRTAKVMSSIISFVVIFVMLQNFLTPKYLNESTTMVDGLRVLDDKDLDVLFLGSSQMFCAVDSKTLTEEYNLSSYNYGASNQYLEMTEYYLTEALKICRPKTVFVEIGNILYSSSEVDDTSLSWNYAPMNASLSKFQSILRVTDDLGIAIKHTFFPLLIYHGRWNEVSLKDISYYFNYSNNEIYGNRGFTKKEEIVPQTMLYQTGGEKVVIPEENLQAMINIKEICNEKGIKAYFFKLPVPFWKKSYSDAMKLFADEQSLEYINFYDYYDEFDLDESKDYRDDHHTNIFGAAKITAFIGEHFFPDGFIEY